MAYMSKEEIKEIRNLIKQSFSKEYKFSITSYHYSGVNIALIKSPIKHESPYTQVNEYHLESQFKDNQELLNLFNKILTITNRVKPYYDRNANDPSADYGDSNYFLNLSIGKYDQPYSYNKILA